MYLTIIGTGYVGLISGLCLAEIGNRVICLDLDEKKIRKLKKGISPFYEPGLEKLLNRNILANKIEFTTSYSKALEKAEIIFICVGTPSKTDGNADLSFVKQAARQIATVLNQNQQKRHNISNSENRKKEQQERLLPDSGVIIVNKSTVPIGTASLVRQIIAKKYKSKFAVISNPEFLREGKAVEDFLQSKRVVIGGQEQWALNKLSELYKPLGITIIKTNNQTAELIKYAANAFLAVKISYINDVAQLAEKIGANIDVVSFALGLDNRIAPAFLKAGLGWGGSCLPKDTACFIKTADNFQSSLEIVQAAVKINQQQNKWAVQKALLALKNLNHKRIAVLGLAFKPETDDIRESPAIKIIEDLYNQGARVKAYDPQAGENAYSYFKSKNFKVRIIKKFQDKGEGKVKREILIYQDLYQVIKKSVALIIATDWTEFKNLDLLKIKELMSSKIIIDGRNILDTLQCRELGFVYFGVGRGLET